MPTGTQGIAVAWNNPDHRPYQLHPQYASPSSGSVMN